ncbi:MAG: DUF2799 domain-containing protein [Acinetobacter sp.]|jgi:hypothetical protein|nr:MAG: DUF2799 domain-containing protein [Acinetobacter sp.]
MKKWLILLSPLYLSACQVMTATECQHANWADLGRQDGLKGYAPRIYSRTDACLKHGIAVPAQQIEKYQTAYKNAIDQYCQPKNIFNLSIIGEGRINACPEPNYSRVKAIYDVGSRYYQNKQDIQETQDRIQTLDDKIDEASTKDERYKLLEEQRQKSKALNRLLIDKQDLQKELDWIRPR